MVRSTIMQKKIKPRRHWPNHNLLDLLYIGISEWLFTILCFAGFSNCSSDNYRVHSICCLSLISQGKKKSALSTNKLERDKRKKNDKNRKSKWKINGKMINLTLSIITSYLNSLNNFFFCFDVCCTFYSTILESCFKQSIIFKHLDNQKISHTCICVVSTSRTLYPFVYSQISI